MLYIPAPESNDGTARVVYKGKNNGVRETFVALDWLARLVTHVPNRGQQLVRYYGYYSNKSRGMRKKTETDNQAPLLVDSDISKKAFRRNWARLIQKVYHTDPLLCSKCNGSMRIISFIADQAMAHFDFNTLRRKEKENIQDKDSVAVPVFLERTTLYETRSLGPELVGHQIWRKLQLDEILISCGFNDYQRILAQAVVIARLAEPDSERQTQNWIQKQTALTEIIALNKAGKNQVYSITDQLLTR